jgi:hypothetical protein
MAPEVESRRLRYGAAAGALAAALVATRFAFAATTDYVFLFGFRLDLPCLVKQAFGVPCPACGMTRSVVMTLHGDLGRALALNPGGPLLVAGLALLVVALAARALTGSPRPALSRYLVPYAAATLSVLVAHWLVVVG